jgi:hypothetical protein
MGRVPVVEERTEKLAIALDDLDRIHPSIKGGLLGAGYCKVDLGNIFRVGEGRVKGGRAMVAFRCSLLEAATICDIVRSHDRKVGDPETFVYMKRGEEWCQVFGTKTLTVVADGKVALNPEVFTPLTKPEGAPPAKVVQFGRRK